MSTKTNFKRVALVAVAALGLGVLTSVAPANAGAPTSNTLHLITSNGAGTGVAGDADLALTNKSGGYVTSSAASVTSSSTATATVLSTGGLTFVTVGAASTCISVNGGRIGSSSGATSFTSDSTVACAAGTVAFAVNVIPNAGVTSMSVAAFQGSGVSYVTPTAGALIGIYAVTVASAASNGVPSAAYSVITQQAAIGASGTTAGSSAYDTTTAIPNGRVGVIYIALKDAYDTSITTGLPITASATNGAKVNLVDDPGTGDAYSALSSFDSETNDGAQYVVVTQPVAGKAGSTTVTITYAGVPVAAKTLTWTGDLAKIEAIEYASGTAGSTGTIRYRFFDDAGNRITDATWTAAYSSTYPGGIGTATLTATGSGNTNQLGTPTGTHAALSGYATFNCVSATKSTSTPLEITAINQAGVTIKAPKFDAHCARATIATYTASFDKAQYQTGDVATLTITAKDLNGAAVASDTTLGAGAVISVGGMTAVSAPTTADTSYNGDGVWTYTYTVGTTAGNYVAAVKLPASAVDDGAKTIQVKIVDSSGGVSNADVLKAIVSLIASINKQIAALQKALLKR